MVVDYSQCVYCEECGDCITCDMCMCQESRKNEMSHLYETRNVPTQNGDMTVTLTSNFVEKIRKQLSLEQDEQVTNEHLKIYFGIET